MATMPELLEAAARHFVDVAPSAAASEQASQVAAQLHRLAREPLADVDLAPLSR